MTNKSKPPKRSAILTRPNTPHVWFEPSVMEKIRLIVETAPKEIGWDYVCSRDRDGDFTVHDCIPPKNQKVSPGTFEYHEDDHGEAIDTLIVNGSFNCEMGEPIRGNWGIGHSHVNMGAFSSTTDEDQMMEYYEKGDPFAIQTVHNKKGAMYVAIFDFENGHYYAPEDLTYSTLSLLSDDEYEDIIKRVKTATTKTYQAKTYSYKRGGVQTGFGFQNSARTSGQGNKFSHPDDPPKWLKDSKDYTPPTDVEIVELEDVDAILDKQAEQDAKRDIATVGG